MTDIQQANPGVDVLEGFEKPMIYSKRAIWGFSFFFKPLFGGILLMQNLKDITKKKEANLVLIVSVLMTALAVAFIMVFDITNKYISFALNGACAAFLTEFFYKKYFPDEVDYEKKKIWKPLIIGILICVAIVFLAFFAQDIQA